jgi:hypothetical protein
MAEKRITIVHDEGGEWVGIYRDGKLQEEGHSLFINTVLRIAGVEFDEVWDWNGIEYGRLPHDLADVETQRV